jgi:hypothetical protein
MGWNSWVQLTGMVGMLFCLVFFTAEYLRYRTKYNIARAFGLLLYLTIFVLDFLYPRAAINFIKSLGFSRATGGALLVLLWTLVLLSLIVLIDYPQIKQFLIKVKQKRKS